jgi:hypothetical protein
MTYEQTTRVSEHVSIPSKYTSNTRRANSQQYWEVHMSYVKRDENGKIIAVSVKQSEGFEEKADIHSEEYVNFISSDLDLKDVKLALEKSDAEIARVTEDLIHLLMDKQLILFTELPRAVQEKLLNREKLRQSLRTQEPSIIDDAGSI